MKGPVLFQGEIKLQNSENTSTKFFNLLLQNHLANLTQFDTKHPWVKGIQVCSNGEPFNSQKVDMVFFSLNQRYGMIICVY